MDSSEIQKKGIAWTRVLAVVSSIVGLISFSMFVTTYIIQKRIEAEQKRQQEAFLKATEKFTNLLETKNEQLQTLSSRLATLDRLKAQVDRIHDRVVRRSRTAAIGEETSDSRARIMRIHGA